MINQYQKLSSKPNIFLMTPPKAFIVEDESSIAFGVCNENILEMCVAIKQLGKKYNLSIIDLNTISSPHSEYFPVDGVHTNAKGAELIATSVYQGISLA